MSDTNQIAKEQEAVQQTDTAHPIEQKWLTTLALVLILLVGGYFRTLGLYTWDGGTYQHPDERFVTYVTSQIQLPSSLDEYFDSARSPANPQNIIPENQFYVYGVLPSLMTRAVAVMLTPGDKTEESLSPLPNPLIRLFNPHGVDYASYTHIYKVGRTLAALFDIASILLIFLIARLCANHRVALLAALLSALTVLHIQQAHFFVDPAFSTFFTLIALHRAIQVAQHGRWRDFIWLGIAIGLAMATRITLASLGMVAIVATMQATLVWQQQRAIRHTTQETPNAKLPARWILFLSRGMALLVLAGLITLITFRITQPYAFVGSTPSSPPLAGVSDHAPWAEGKGFFDVRFDPRFVKDLSLIKQLNSGEVDYPPSLQWVNRPAYLFPLKNLVLWGMGPLLGIAAWLGWIIFGVWFFRKILGKNTAKQDNSGISQSTIPAGLLLLWVWVGFYFAWQGGQFAVALRYMMPISGALTIFAAWVMMLAGSREGLGIREKSRAGSREGLGSREDPPVGIWKRLGIRMWMWRAVLLLVVVTTFVWAYSFTRIYSRPHTRVAAARWLVQHAPPGATIAHEWWDDPLPFDFVSSYQWFTPFQSIKLATYAQEDPNKYYSSSGGEGLFDQLDKADFLTLTSNRVYDSIQQLPMRYPVTIRFYHELFAGNLGYELVADFASEPSVMGIPLSDLDAEESFRVYDHPHVLIFRKTPYYSRQQAEDVVLANANWDEVYTIPIEIADQAPTALRLTEQAWKAYHKGGTWAQEFDRRSVVNNWRLSPFFWFATLELLGIATFFILFRLFPGLPDRGFSLARVVGLVLVAWMAWMLGSLHLLPFTTRTVWACATPLLIIGLWMGWRSRAELAFFWRRRWKVLVTAEMLYIVAFALMLVVRWYNPDIWHPWRGGEKPMEFAYLNAILQSEAFPPYDPWFAGGYINYYYFGFVLIGTLIHLTDIVPNIAFNLAVPTLFALTALGAWGVVYNMVGRDAKRQSRTGGVARYAPTGGNRGACSSVPLSQQIPYSRGSLGEFQAYVSALLAPILLLLMGNLAQAIWFVNGYAAEQTHRPEWAFWDATRIVQGTINEFPFFTFLFADMHPHMIVMPFSLCLLGLSVALLRLGQKVIAPHTPNGGIWQSLLVIRPIYALPHLFLIGLFIGLLGATNTWDVPTFGGLALLALILLHMGRWKRDQRVYTGSVASGRQDVQQPRLIRYVVSFGVSLLVVWLIQFLTFLPFQNHFATVSSGVAFLRDTSQASWWLEVWHAERTSLVDILRIHGLWLFLVVSTLLMILRRWLHAPVWSIAFLMAALITLIVFGIQREYASPALTAPLLIGIVLLLWYLRTLPARVTFPLWWAALALAICLGVEIVYIKGDVGRMNTVFKFGLHAWMLFALAAAVALPWMWELVLPKKKILPRRHGDTEKKQERTGVAERAVPNVLEVSPRRHGDTERTHQQTPLVERLTHWLWRVATVLLIAASLVYPITATPSRIEDRHNSEQPKTLDGTAFMNYVSGSEEGTEFPLSEDYAAIRWLQEHIQGTPIILEAHQPSYRWGGRIATFTGLPTLFGWEWHQIQQRSLVNTHAIVDWDQAERPYAIDLRTVLDRRIELIPYIYNTTDLEEAARIIDAYGIEYIYVGGVEHALYDPFGLAKFDEMVRTGFLQEVFRFGSTTIYQVRNPGTPTLLTTSLSADPPERDKEATPPLMLKQPVNTLPAMHGYAWNNWANADSVRAAGVWLFALYLLALLGLPLTMLLFSRWFAAGIAWSRLVGLIVLGYIIWIITSLEIVPYSLWTLGGGIIFLILLNVMILAWVGGGNIAKGLRVFGRRIVQCRWHILISETIFLLGFLFFTIVRAHNPDLWHPIWGGEKPMEFGFLNAMMRSPVMPPYTPFFSDGYINYYYYGFFLFSLPIKATGIHPAIAFNLIIPTLFALALNGGYALVHQLTKRIHYGILGAAFLALFGNLATFFKVGWSQGITPIKNALFNPFDTLPFIERFQDLGNRIGDWYIGPSRIITEPNFTINEFPFWSFLFADLHPHIIDLPITLLAIALAFQIVAFGSKQKTEHTSSDIPYLAPLLFVFAALVLGTLAVTNSWDFPTYTLLIGAALVGSAWRRRATMGFGKRVLEIGKAGILAIGIAATGLLLYAPFFEAYHAMVSGIGRVKDGMNIRDFLVVHGIFIAIIIPFTFGAVWRMIAMRRRLRKRKPKMVAWQPVPPVTITPSATVARITKQAGIVSIVGSFIVVLVSFAVGLLRKSASVSRIASGGLLLALLAPVFARGVWKKRIHHGDTETRREEKIVGAQCAAPPMQQSRTGDTIVGAQCAAPPMQQSRTGDTIVGAQNAVSPYRNMLTWLGRLALLILFAVLAWASFKDPFVAVRLWTGALIAIGAAILLPRRLAASTWFIFLMITLAWSVTFGIETIFIKDHLQGGGSYRMNTVFKFGIQIWTLLAVASAACLPYLLNGLHRLGAFVIGVLQTSLNRQNASQPRRQQGLPHIGGMLFQGIGVFLLTPLLLIGALFPVVGTPSRVANRFNGSSGLTLDGLAFMQYANFEHEGKWIDLQYDGEAIAWINKHMEGTPIVLQSGLWFYRTYGIRIASNTGMPTLVSSLHENEQRDPGVVGLRDGEMNAIYRTTDADETLRLLEKYHINYVYIGAIEQAFYPPEGLAKFESVLSPFLDLVYYNEGARLYRVKNIPQAYAELPVIEQSSDIPSLEQPIPPPSFVPSDYATLEQQSTETLESYIAMEPDNKNVAITLARRYQNLRQFQDAIDILQPIVATYPQDILMQHMLGDMLARLGRLDEAEDVYQRAALTSGKSADWDKFGRELLYWGRLDKAELALIRAITIEPVDPPAYYHLGVVYYQQQEWKKAAKYLELYLDVMPDGNDSEASRKLLGEIYGN